jgi:UDP-glucose 4-epimerase
MTAVAVVGASGFIGHWVADALQRRGAQVAEVQAPRLTTSARTVSGLRGELSSRDVLRAKTRLREALSGADRVVNAAGVSAAGAKLGDDLVGANALLPAVVEAARPRGARLVHVSSAAVQGRRPVLDETHETRPFSPYSQVKTWGEELLCGCADTVIYRPTSVHGADRQVTRSLLRLLASRFASVAGPGDRPTPQVLVVNVGDAIAAVTLDDETPPPVVLHPGEGLTTAELVRVAGGREPVHVPVPLARALVSGARLAGRTSAKAAAAGRRAEMLWFGQAQAPSWLEGRWVAPVGHEGWKELHG